MDFYSIIEKARKSGKVEKGTNEVTKAAERATARLFFSSDVEPKEIVAHLPLICKEKNIPCKEVDSKKKLGVAVGISVGCSAVAITDSGDAEKDVLALAKSK